MPAFVAGPRTGRTAVLAAALVLAASIPAAVLAFRSQRVSPPDPGPAVIDPAAPRTFVGITTRGTMVLADSRNGRPIRTLVSRGMLRPTDQIRSLRLTPDRSRAYFVIHHDDDCSDVATVSVAGGPMRVVARGDSPSVSPDGARLAFVELLNCGGMKARVVVRDIATGAERAWEEKPGGDFFPHLAAAALWSPDPRYLIVRDCGADACEARLLDSTVAGPDLWPATRKMPGGEASGDGFWSCLEVRGARGTLVVKPHLSDERGDEPLPINELDLRTGKLRNLAPVGRDLGCPTFDAAGDHALFFRSDVLYRWDLADPEVIAAGYAEAAW